MREMDKLADLMVGYAEEMQRDPQAASKPHSLNAMVGALVAEEPTYGKSLEKFLLHPSNENANAFVSDLASSAIGSATGSGLEKLVHEDASVRQQGLNDVLAKVLQEDDLNFIQRILECFAANEWARGFHLLLHMISDSCVQLLLLFRH